MNDVADPDLPPSPDVFPAAAIQRVSKIAERDLPVMEQQHRLSAEAPGSIADAGFARHFVPQRFGGTAGTFSSLLTASAAVAETCLSTAWCATLFAAHGRLASYLPEEGRQALWGRSPDTLISAAIMPPRGEAVPERGGWRISGRWETASGADHADWLLVASRTGGPDRPEHRVFAVPRKDWTVLDTWRSLGMRGTGSNAVDVEQAFVPASLSFTLDDLDRPQEDGAARCHRVPYLMVGALMFAAPIVGAAQGALDAWRSAAVRRGGGGGAPAPVRRTETDKVLAESSAQIAAARLLLERAARRADAAEATQLLAAENRRDAVMAVTWCAAAADRLFHASGSRAHRDDSPLQRHWRDITTAASHGALGLDAAATGYAAASLGPSAPSGA